MDITEGSEHLTEPVRLSTRPVVVGVDGSKGSSVALAWAAREARMRHVALTVIHTWRIPALAYNGYFAGPVDTGDWRRCAVESTEQQIVDVLGEHPDLEVVVEIKEGDTAHVLVEASHDAEVLVVGSRGHGGFGGLLLGSVSSQVAHHAICPVVIVHDGA